MIKSQYTGTDVKLKTNTNKREKEGHEREKRICDTTEEIRIKNCRAAAEKVANLRQAHHTKWLQGSNKQAG